MLLDLMVARRELGSVTRTDKLLGMARRVSSAEMRAVAAPAGGARAGTDAASRTVPVPAVPDARTPRTTPAEAYPSRRYSLAARIATAVTALLALGAVAFWLFT